MSPFKAGSEVYKFNFDPCEYFRSGKIKASTLSLSVLVAIEMFNSLNALSKDGSLVTMPPWVNPWLLLAMSVSFALHFLILYVPFLARVFGIVPLSTNEWMLVIVVALLVILIDEVKMGSPSLPEELLRSMEGRYCVELEHQVID